MLATHFYTLALSLLQLSGVWNECSFIVDTTTGLVNLCFSVLAGNAKPVWCQQDFTKKIETMWEQSDNFVKLWCVASEDEIRRNKAIITTSWKGVEDGANWEMEEDCRRGCIDAFREWAGEKKPEARMSCCQILGHGSNRVCHIPWCLQGWSS